MDTNTKIGNIPSATVLGMFADLSHKLQHGSLTVYQLEKFLKKQNPFVLSHEQVADWVRMYREVFGIEVDTAELKIPKQKKGFDRLIVVAPGLMPNQIYEAMGKIMPVWRYKENLNDITSERKTDKLYAIWVREREEADEELKNLSAGDLKKKSVAGITFEERGLYEIIYFRETGKHLDIYNWTLCSGSRYPDGSVPSMLWFNGRVGMHWSLSDDREGILRSRVVVS
jgi:hypothetical protein